MKIFIVDVTFQYRVPVFAQDEAMAEQIACEHKNEIEWFDADVDTAKAREVTAEEALEEFDREVLVFMADGDKILKDIVYGHDDERDQWCIYCEELVQHCLCWREVY